MTGARLVTEERALAELVADLADEPEYAVDTEFHRERTYWPTVALVQIGWGDGQVALVDPLAVSLAPLAEVLRGPGTAVMHAATQDLEVLLRACGTVPTALFDTQLAAGFAGFGTPSLALLAERILGISLPKASRLTDWLRRPLTEEQLAYAAADVAHLLPLARSLRAALDAVGRLGWAQDECDELRSRSLAGSDPSEAWLRLKEGRSLKGKARGIAQEVAAWRERRAAEIDQPVRHVLPDLAIVGIATRPPRDLDGLRQVRGLEERHARGRVGEELLAAIDRGRQLSDDEIAPQKREEVDREQRPAVALVSAWLSQLGRDLRIDPALLATRADLAAFLAGDETCRLATGWRRDLLGEPVRRLLAGEFALAFDGRGQLALERRSGDPVVIDLPVPALPVPPETGVGG